MLDDATVQKPMEVNLALIAYYDKRLKDLERHTLTTAKRHEAHPLSL